MAPASASLRQARREERFSSAKVAPRLFEWPLFDGTGPDLFGRVVLGAEGRSRPVYRHPSCLIKHRWEHSPHWREASKFMLSKHQQVQLLEAAAILSHLAPSAAGGRSLPEDRSLWPSYMSGGLLPPPDTANGAQQENARPGLKGRSPSTSASLDQTVMHPVSSSVPAPSLLSASVNAGRGSTRSPSAGPRMHEEKRGMIAREADSYTASLGVCKWALAVRLAALSYINTSHRARPFALVSSVYKYIDLIATATLAGTNDELLSAILFYFGVDPRGNKSERPDQKTLLQCAVVSQAFSDVALSLLWVKIDDISVLVKMLPSFCRFQSQPGPSNALLKRHDCYRATRRPASCFATIDIPHLGVSYPKPRYNCSYSQQPGIPKDHPPKRAGIEVAPSKDTYAAAQFLFSRCPNLKCFECFAYGGFERTPLKFPGPVLASLTTLSATLYQVHHLDLIMNLAGDSLVVLWLQDLFACGLPTLSAILTATRSESLHRLELDLNTWTTEQPLYETTLAPSIQRFSSTLRYLIINLDTRMRWSRAELHSYSAVGTLAGSPAGDTRA
ncbi:hypothetical protein NUW54_g9901 [Trametes sanguinea]|uniref:Uncharacterized protein n=1 Tax=Trametes sanguinea TaxID=158606 RepID=A0ACC1P4G0_9APHY|nr:hypothetical protein NUW54_g9901 [Trametes sanguinea]